MPTLFLVLISSTINSAAQLCLKLGADRISSFEWAHGRLLLALLSNPYLVLGGILYVSSVFVWIIVLSRVPVSFAYPLSSIGYITTAIAAVIFLNEYLSFTRIIGILVIIFGVYLITRTA